MPSSRESGRDRALHYLRETVLADPDVQGTFLNEVELAGRIGVSRTPVREALLLLVADGLVEILPGRGAYVPPMTGRQIRELMELRELLERHAAQVAIGARAVPMEQMRAVLADQRDLAGAGGDPATFIELDMMFHKALVEAAGNALIARTYSGLRVRQRRAGVSALFRTADRQRAVCDEHAAIVDALAGADTEAAATAITEHLRLTEGVLLHA